MTIADKLAAALRRIVKLDTHIKGHNSEDSYESLGPFGIIANNALYDAEQDKVELERENNRLFLHIEE